jgi:hypothetical protein
MSFCTWHGVEIDSRKIVKFFGNWKVSKNVYMYTVGRAFNFPPKSFELQIIFQFITMRDEADAG